MTTKHAEAIAQGYKDETCARCGTLFEAHIHFIRCGNDPCPMRSAKDPRTILERLLDESSAAISSGERTE